MDARERVAHVLRGDRPDRPPVSFWHHFPLDQVHGAGALKAHIAHLEAYDLDFLKVMDDNGYPHSAPIETAGDLSSVGELKGDEPEFARQLDLLADLKRAFSGRVPLVTTVFNAWATLRRLVKPPTRHGPPNLDASADEPSQIIREFFLQDPAGVRKAIQTIAINLADFVRRCLAAGADGVFLSVRDDWLDSPGQTGHLYNDLVRPSDLEILRAASEASFNLLHICGKAVDFRAFAAYPVHALNWADRAAGPSITRVRAWVKPAICTGVDNLTTLPDGTPEDCEREVADALAQAGDRSIMIAPGCTYDPGQVPGSNLEAICRAARA